MASKWDLVPIKELGRGQKSASREEANRLMEMAASTWSQMGLSQEQIAFGIALMNVESGFNSAARGISKTEYGLGQFTDDTWNFAVLNYNSRWNPDFEVASSRRDETAQIWVLGDWVLNYLWPKAQEKLTLPEFRGYTIYDMAYAGHHEGFGNNDKLIKYLQDGYIDYIEWIDGEVRETIEKILRGDYQSDAGSLIIAERSRIDKILSIFAGTLYAAETSTDPLVLDLDNDGIETTHLKDGAYFDHGSDGFAEQTGWAAADDGLLVLDRNSDGLINDGTELFGDQTILRDGTKAAHGFAALAEWDDNRDGKIDSADTVWSQLAIWQGAGVVCQYP